MKVLIISVNREEMNMRTWPYGAACVASACKKAGHNTELLDIIHAPDPQQAIHEKIASFEPDAVGISIRNIDNQAMTNTMYFMDEIRALLIFIRKITKSPIILGGAGYSIFPEPLLTLLEADYGIQGEGEWAFPELLQFLENGKDPISIPGVICLNRKAGPLNKYHTELDALPFPDLDLIPNIEKPDPGFWFPVQTRRGCPMKCSYCSTATIEGCILRKRNPDDVVNWLKSIVARGMNQFYFVDNTFNIPQSYAKELCRKICAAGLDIHWRCILYPTKLDSDLVKLMADSGCSEVSIGFESGSELILYGMNKKFKLEDVRQVCDILHKENIRRMGFLMLGGPGETRETVMESLKFAESLNLDLMKLTVGIRIYPYTQLAKIAVQNKIIQKDDDLLLPRFYLEPHLVPWIYTIVDEWMESHPNWIMATGEHLK